MTWWQLVLNSAIFFALGWAVTTNAYKRGRRHEREALNDIFDRVSDATRKDT